MKAGNPGNDAHVLGKVHPSNFNRREWRRIRTRAGLPERKLKDLRDTYASHLLSANIPLPYVSKQLGHGDVLTTARHYARWIDASGRYVAPPCAAGR